MDHCPNCHAPLRPGAKFCTSCGHRIGEPFAAPPPPPSWPEPAAEAPVAAWPEPQAAAQAAWPAPQETAGGWPAPPAEGGWPAPPAEGGWPAAPAAAVSHAIDLDAPHVHEAAPVSTPEATLQPAAEVSWPAEAVIAERAETVVAAPATDTLAVVAAALPDQATGEDARARAVELLQELRDLLPRIANPTGLDPARLADILETGVAADRTRWAGLRAVMERARDNPRDVETVLLLSQQVDEVIALVDRHEQLTAAVERAVVQLRAGNG